MKTLYFLLSLSLLLTGCSGFEVTPDDGSAKEEKVQITGSLIPRKQPKGVEIVNKEGFEKAMDDAGRANGIIR